jgi:uncharacterized protein
MRKVTRTVPAPADLGNEVIGVPAGSDLELQLRLEAVMEGVLVSATVRVRATGECVRCQDELEEPLEVEFQELYAYAVPDDHDDETELSLLEGDLIDLETALRDAVVLALPLHPVCSVDCPGLCPECGVRLADDPDHRHALVDQRWAALQSLKDAGTTDTKTQEK